MRRLYAAMPAKVSRKPAAAVREGLSLFAQLLREVVLKGRQVPILDAFPALPMTRNLDVQILADALYRGIGESIALSTGSNRVASWLKQRLTTDGNAHSATFEVNFYWDEPSEMVLVSLKGDAEAMAMCTIDTLWRPIGPDLSVLPGKPLPLEAAIAAAADHR